METLKCDLLLKYHIFMKKLKEIFLILLMKMKLKINKNIMHFIDAFMNDDLSDDENNVFVENKKGGNKTKIAYYDLGSQVESAIEENK